MAASRKEEGERRKEERGGLLAGFLAPSSVFLSPFHHTFQ
jgi:hypothetical protein